MEEDGKNEPHANVPANGQKVMVLGQDEVPPTAANPDFYQR